MDVWQYIFFEKLEIPSIYFSHKRACINRNGMLLSESKYITKKGGETTSTETVRFRTVGDMTCTGAVLSSANSLEQIIEEVAASRQTERGGRADDKRSDAAMEDRKKEGYF
jgi:sulfate adenylyltransferase subunit 2